jgi:hypothetical protein
VGTGEDEHGARTHSTDGSGPKSEPSRPSCPARGPHRLMRKP